jgi:hypothetical protein
LDVAETWRAVLQMGYYVIGQVAETWRVVLHMGYYVIGQVAGGHTPSTILYWRNN